MTLQKGTARIISLTLLIMIFLSLLVLHPTMTTSTLFCVCASVALLLSLGFGMYGGVGARQKEEVLIELIERHSLTINGDKVEYYVNIDGHYIDESLSTDKDKATEFYNKVVELNGNLKTKTILKKYNGENN